MTDCTATSIDIAGRADVPDDATAAVYNLTSVDATAPGYATSYPCDAPVRPEASNLNYGPGQVVANGTITVRRGGRMHHIGVGNEHAGKTVRMLIHDLDVITG